MKDTKKLGTYVKELRTARSWTQQQLADAASLDKKTVQRVERAESVPSKETVQALAGALDIQVEQLTSLLEGPPKPKARQPKLAYISDGHELLKLLIGAHGFRHNADNTDDDQVAELISEILGATEFAEIAPELAPSDVYNEGRRLTRVVSDLHRLDWHICGIIETGSIAGVAGLTIVTLRVMHMTAEKVESQRAEFALVARADMEARVLYERYFGPFPEKELPN